MSFNYKTHAIVDILNIKGTFYIEDHPFKIKNLLLIGEYHSYIDVEKKQLLDRQNYFFKQFKEKVEKRAKIGFKDKNNNGELILLFEGFASLTRGEEDYVSLPILSATLCVDYVDINQPFYCKYSDYRPKFLLFIIHESYKFNNQHLGKINCLEEFEKMKKTCSKNSILTLINYLQTGYDKEFKFKESFNYSYEYIIYNMYRFLNGEKNVDVYLLGNTHQLIYSAFIFTLVIDSRFSKTAGNKFIDNMFEKNIGRICKLWLFRFFYYIEKNMWNITDLAIEFLSNKMAKHIKIDKETLNKQMQMMRRPLVLNKKFKSSFLIDNNKSDLSFYRKIFYCFLNLRNKKEIKLSLLEDLIDKIKLLLNNYNKTIETDEHFDQFDENQFLSYSRKLCINAKYNVNILIFNLEDLVKLKISEKNLINYVDEHLMPVRTKNKSFYLTTFIEVIKSFIFLLEEEEMEIIYDDDELFVAFLDKHIKLDFFSLTEEVGHNFFHFPIMEMCVLLFLINFGEKKSIIFESGRAHTTQLRQFLNNMEKKDNFGGIIDNSTFKEEEIEEKINTFLKNV